MVSPSGAERRIEGMRKVIKGRLYDTNSARLIGTRKGISLYGTKSGCYFVASGPSILPVTKEQAVRWSIDELGRDLTVPPAKPIMESITVSMTREEKARMEQLAADADMTVSAYIRERCL